MAIRDYKDTVQVDLGNGNFVELPIVAPASKGTAKRPNINHIGQAYLKDASSLSAIEKHLVRAATNSKLKSSGQYLTKDGKLSSRSDRPVNPIYPVIKDALKQVRKSASRIGPNVDNFVSPNAPKKSKSPKRPSTNHIGQAYLNDAKNLNSFEKQLVRNAVNNKMKWDGKYLSEDGKVVPSSSKPKSPVYKAMESAYHAGSKYYNQGVKAYDEFSSTVNYLKGSGGTEPSSDPQPKQPGAGYYTRKNLEKMVNEHLADTEQVLDSKGNIVPMPMKRNLLDEKPAYNFATTKEQEISGNKISAPTYTDAEKAELFKNANESLTSKGKAPLDVPPSLQGKAGGEGTPGSTSNPYKDSRSEAINDSRAASYDRANRGFKHPIFNFSPRAGRAGTSTAVLGGVRFNYVNPLADVMDSVNHYKTTENNNRLAHLQLQSQMLKDQEIMQLRRDELELKKEVAKNKAKAPNFNFSFGQSEVDAAIQNAGAQ